MNLIFEEELHKRDTSQEGYFLLLLGLINMFGGLKYIF